MPDLDSDDEESFLEPFPLCPEDDSFAAFLVEVAEGDLEA